MISLAFSDALAQMQYILHSISVSLPDWPDVGVWNGLSVRLFERRQPITPHKNETSYSELNYALLPCLFSNGV